MPAGKRKRRLKVKNIVLAVLLLVILIVTGYFIFIYFQLNHRELNANNLGISSEMNESGFQDDQSDNSITNIALFGVDERAGETKFRSDAMMVLTVDKEHDKIKLSSIMRDMRVPIDDNGQNKIAHAYFYGGPELAVRTLNQVFELNIKEFVTVNFNRMAQIINAVNGVDIDISEEERVNANNSIREQSEVAGLPKDYIKKSGLQTLNGTQAVAYARIRYVGNADFQRTSRQRDVLKKVFEKVLQMNAIQYPEFARKFLPAVETSLDVNDVFQLGGILLRKVTFEDMRFPDNSDLIGDGTIMIGGTSFLNADLQATKEHMHQFIYDDIDPFATPSDGSSEEKIST
ncbi:MAG: LCP family protein [Oscillospiraceae bacterium]